MDIETLRHGLLWCTVFNYLILLTWFVIFMLPHHWLYRLCGPRFHLTEEQMDRLSFSGIMFYKLGVIFFNLVPLIVLYIVY